MLIGYTKNHLKLHLDYRALVKTKTKLIKSFGLKYVRSIKIQRKFGTSQNCKNYPTNFIDERGGGKYDFQFHLNIYKIKIQTRVQNSRKVIS